MIFVRNLRLSNPIRSKTISQTQLSSASVIFQKASLLVAINSSSNKLSQGKSFLTTHYFSQSNTFTQGKKICIGAEIDKKACLFSTTFCTSRRLISVNTTSIEDTELSNITNEMCQTSLSPGEDVDFVAETSCTIPTLSTEKQYQLVSMRLNLPVASVCYTLEHSRKGATVPFLARYRRDETGQLDEVQLRLILSTAEEVAEVHRRRTFMLKSLKQRGLLTEELQRTLESMVHLSQLEDVWEPFKVRKTSLASRGRDAGLSQFAEALLHQGIILPNQSSMISRLEDGTRLFVALLAEEIQRLDTLRQELLYHVQHHAYLTSLVVQQSRKKVVKEMEEDTLQHLRGKFQYYDGKRWPLHRVNSHNVLALHRGELKGILRVDVETPPTCEPIFEALVRKKFRGIAKFLCSSDSRHNYASGKYVAPARISTLNSSNLKEAVQLLLEGISLAYKTLIKSIKHTIRRDLKKSADQEAILVFEHNLRYMLLQRPLSRARILAMDPGITNGIKCVALDENGEVMSFFKCTLMDEKRMRESIHKIVEEKRLNKIIIGNGTASQQTACLVARTIQERKWEDVEFSIVSEAGASVYSVSDIAKEEFPTLDVMYRGAVSIGRRVLDPLSELVKIPVRSMGIGMYQHDVNEKELLKRLNHVVESCVALVGINALSSNRYVMEKVPGIQKKLVDQIVLSRHTKHLKTREDLRRVPGMTEVVYNQVAGFFRFPNSSEPLDSTNIHPESYPLVKQLMKLYNQGELGWCAGPIVNPTYQQLGLAVSNLPDNALIGLAKRLNCGPETLKLVGHELLTPALDPRDTLPHSGFLRRDVKEARHLKKGDLLTGVVLSVTTFGAFVDFGLHDSVLVRGSGVDQLRVGEMIKDLKFIGLDHLQRVQVEQYNPPLKDVDQQKSRDCNEPGALRLEYADLFTSQGDLVLNKNTGPDGSKGLAAYLRQAHQQLKEKDAVDSRLPHKKNNTIKRPRVGAEDESMVAAPVAIFKPSENSNFVDNDEVDGDQREDCRQPKRGRIEDQVQLRLATVGSVSNGSLQAGLPIKVGGDKSAASGQNAFTISDQHHIHPGKIHSYAFLQDEVSSIPRKESIRGKKDSRSHRMERKVLKKKLNSEIGKNGFTGSDRMSSVTSSASFGVKSTKTQEHDFILL